MCFLKINRYFFSLLLFLTFASCGKNFHSDLSNPERGGDFFGFDSPIEFIKSDNPSLDQESKKVMLLFSSTICSSCIREHQEIIRYLNGRTPENLTLITYMTGGNDTPNKVDLWTKSAVKGINWPVKVDSDQRLFKSLCERNVTPCTVIFDEMGNVTYSSSKRHSLEELTLLTGPWFNQEPADNAHDKDEGQDPIKDFPFDNGGKKSVVLIGESTDKDLFDFNDIISREIEGEYLKMNVYTIFANSKSSDQKRYCPKGLPCLAVLNEKNELTHSGPLPKSFKELENIAGPLILKHNLNYKKLEEAPIPAKAFQAYDNQEKKLKEIDLRDHPNKMLLILSAGITCDACIKEHQLIYSRLDEIKDHVTVYSVVAGLNLQDPEKIDQWFNNSKSLWPSFGSPTFGELMGLLITKNNDNLSTPAMLLLDEDNKFIYGHAYDFTLSEEQELSPKEAVNHLFDVIQKQANKKD